MVRVLEVDAINGDALRGQRADKILIDARALRAFVHSPYFSVRLLQRFVSDCDIVTTKAYVYD